MKILYIITRAERGGAQAHVLELLGAAKKSDEVLLATGEVGYLTEAARRLNVEVIILKNLVHPIRPRIDLAVIRETAELLRRTRPDIVHCHSSKAGFIGRMAAHFVGIPSIFTAHGWEFAPGLAMFRRLCVLPCEWIAARVCQRIITVSRADLNLAVRYQIADQRKLGLVHNGIADNGLQADPGRGMPVVVTMVARLASPKDPDTLLRALAKTGADWRLNLVGDGPDLSRVKQLADDLGIAERISFMGDRDDVASILQRSHVFALISRKEGFPITILEAMRAGLPIVATSVGGIPEQVEDFENGYLVPTGDVDTLSSRLGDLITSPKLRARMGLASRDRFQRSFGAEQMVRSTWEVYQSVLESLNTYRRVVNSPVVRLGENLADAAG